MATISYGSCNGLVCLLPIHNNNRYAGGVLLWNPALHQAEYVPIKRPQETICSSWFGYDNDEYKLVLGTDSHIHLIRLYIDTDAWKSSLKIDPNYSSCEEIGTHVHRTVHWPAYSWEYKNQTIISYDLSNETVGWIAIPVGVNNFYPFELGQIDGYLSVLFGKIDHMEQWVMKEYGVEKFWAKLMILPSNILRSVRYAGELNDHAEFSFPIYGKRFYVESLISPRSIQTKMC